MAASEQKLNKIFDQNVEITGTLTVGGNSILTSYTETDPTVPSHVKSITSTNIANWNTAYGWGNHADAGYITSVPAPTLDLQDVTDNGATTTRTIQAGGLKTDLIQSASQASESFIDLDDDLWFAGASTNVLTLSSKSHMVFVSDTNSNGTTENFSFYTQGTTDANATKLFEIKQNGSANIVSGNLQIGGNNVIDSSRAASFQTLQVAGNSNLSGTVTIDTGSSSVDALVIRGDSPTISFIDDNTTGSDDFYIHVNSNNFYILRDAAGSDTIGGGWDSPHPLQLEGDTNIGYLFGSRMFADNYHPNADKWTTARTLTINGDASGSVSWDGSANATLTLSVGDADTVGGLSGSYLNHRNYTDTDNYLGGYYVSGGAQKPNSSVFGAGKLKIAMLSGGNLGFGGSWNDVLWMSTYTGGDVKRSTALVSSKYDDTSLWIAKQNFDAADWGTGYLIWNSGNDGSGSGLDADDLDGFTWMDSGKNVRGDYVYVGSGGGYFYNDSSSRIRTNYDFYTNNSNTYLYATNLYLGAGSGDNVLVRGNRIYGNNWEIDTDGSAGFGTASAASQVHIVDTVFPQLRVHDDTSGGKGGIRLKSKDATNGLHADIYAQKTGDETGYISFQVPYNGRELRLSDNGSLSFGIPGSGGNTNGRYLSFEGNADGSGEGSGRLFFTEHNSTTASMDNYGMSIGYRGGGTTVTTAGGNSWTGLSQIGNGQWGMWGHDNNLAGNLIMYGDRQATYVDFAGNNIQGITDIYVADQIIHTGDTNTYLQFHANDLFRVVIAGAEVNEWGANYMKMRDSVTFRMGEGSDFRQWHDGTNHYFRNYHHAGGNIYFQSEGTGGVNHALLYMRGDTTRPYIQLYEDGLERLRTINGGVTVYGRIELDDSNTKLLKGSGNSLNITTNSGNVNIGPQNGSWCHFTTDRAGNYFDKKVIVDSGTIGSYNEDLSLVRANGTADRILIRATSIGFFLDSAEDMRLENDGDLHVEGDVIAYSSTISDKRLKDDVETIPNALDKVKALRGVEYTWNKGHREGQRDLGLIAQEVEQVLPEIVREKKMPLLDDTEEKYKTVDYEKITGVLIEAVKELSNKVEELENKLNGSIGTEA